MAPQRENIVYIATSLDGMIAGKDGDLAWLPTTVDESNAPLTFADLMNRVDALVMGRTTYETVLGFGGDWPYSKPVFVLSTTLTEVPQHLNGKVNFLKGAPADVTKTLNDQGFNSLYIEGGAVVQSFLNTDLIDRMFLTRVHTVLGEVTSLFAGVQGALKFSHIQTKSLGDAAIMSEYKRCKA